MIPSVLVQNAKARLPQPVIDGTRALVRVGSPARRRYAATRRAEADRDQTFVRQISADNSVLAGPFAGLRLDTRQTWTSLAPYVVGSYEDELHQVLERMIELKPGRVVDVGAADGYYAVGLAQRLPDAEVVAFEVDDYSRRSCERVAAANGLSDRVKIRRTATPSSLARALTTGALLVIDCEGAEDQLLDPGRLPVLAACSIVAELHDFDGTGLPARVTKRFQGTHDIQLITARPKSGSDYASRLPHLSPEQRDRAVDEHRVATAGLWAAMTPVRDTPSA